MGLEEALYPYPMLKSIYLWIGFLVVIAMLWIAIAFAANRVLGVKLPQPLYLGAGVGPYQVNVGEQKEEAAGEAMIGLPCMSRITENKLTMAKWNDSSMPCIPDPSCAQ